MSQPIENPDLARPLPPPQGPGGSTTCTPGRGPFGRVHRPTLRDPGGGGRGGDRGLAALRQARRRRADERREYVRLLRSADANCRRVRELAQPDPERRPTSPATRPAPGRADRAAGPRPSTGTRTPQLTQYVALLTLRARSGRSRRAPNRGREVDPVAASSAVPWPRSSPARSGSRPPRAWPSTPPGLDGTPRRPPGRPRPSPMPGAGDDVELRYR